VAWRALPADRGPSRPDRRSLVDAALVASGVAVLLLALTLVASNPVWLVLTVAAVPPLRSWLRGPGGRPVTGMLRSAGLMRPHGAVLALAGGFATMRYVLALHLQRDDGVSATVTGLVLLAFPLGMGLAGPLGGRFADRYGARPVAAIGATLTAAGLLLLVPLDDGWAPLDIAWRLALAGSGMGLNGGPTSALTLSAAPPGRMATVGSTLQLARSLGFTLGPALATAVLGLPGQAGVRAGLTLAAAAACLAVPLVAVPAPVRRRAHRGRRDPRISLTPSPAGGRHVAVRGPRGRHSLVL
jgi:MFS family permease